MRADDSAEDVTRQLSKNGRKKITKSNAPVAKQLRKRTPAISRRNSERSSPITSVRTLAKVGRRRATFAARGATHAVSVNEENSDTELEYDDNTEQENSSDGAEESLTLADVKKGLDVKFKHGRTSPGSDDDVPAIVASEKSKCGRRATTKKEKPPSIDATSLDSDLGRSADTLVIKTNFDNSDEEKKACDTKCAELVDDVVTIESMVRRVRADDDKPADVPMVKLATECLDISNEAVHCDMTISDESTSHIGDGDDSPILATESEKGAPVENDTEMHTQTPSMDVPCHKDDITSDEVKQASQFEANNSDKSTSAIGCCALDEQVIIEAAAAPQTNAISEETEPVNGKTAVSPLAAMPTPDDADSSIDAEDDCAHGDADLPGEERNTEATLAKDRTQTYDVTEQDVADVASSENRVEILR